MMVLGALSQGVCADDYFDATAGRGQIITPAYFGVHFHRLVPRTTDKAVRTQWPPLSFGTVRIWDSRASWMDVAPSPGQWTFDVLDTYVNAAVAHQATVMYTLGLTPRWASARPDEQCSYGYGCAAESVRIGHWDEYVRRVAQRYGKRIGAYELWNEPKFSDIRRDRGGPGFYTGSISQMVEMARVARKVLDEVSPDAQLCTPGFVNGPDRLDMFLAAGGKQYVQAVCYHFYSENARHFARQILDVQAVMKRHGVEKRPLWNTETGVDTLAKGAPPSGISAYSREEAVARLSQMLILGAAAGLERFDYYAWDNTHSGMVSSDGSQLPGYAAMQRLHSWLIGARLTACRDTNGGVSCDALKGQERFLLVWADKVKALSISAPSGWRIASVEPLFGEPVTDSVASRPDAMPISVGLVPLRLMLARADRP